MSPRARHLQEMRVALAEGISLSAARHRLAELRLRAVRQARAARASEPSGGGFLGDQPPAGQSKSFWWNDQ